MTAKRQAEIEAYRGRVRELRAEAVKLAHGEGEQTSLPIPLASVVDIRKVRARNRRRGWVQP